MKTSKTANTNYRVNGTSSLNQTTYGNLGSVPSTLEGQTTSNADQVDHLDYLPVARFSEKSRLIHPGTYTIVSGRTNKEMTIKVKPSLSQNSNAGWYKSYIISLKIDKADNNKAESVWFDFGYIAKSSITVWFNCSNENTYGFDFYFKLATSIYPLLVAIGSKSEAFINVQGKDGQLYANTIVRCVACRKCGETLYTTASIKNGIGPVCAKRLSASTGIDVTPSNVEPNVEPLTTLESLGLAPDPKPIKINGISI